MSQPEACAPVVAEAAALGGLDGLVLNVGIGLGRGVTGTSAEQRWRVSTWLLRLERSSSRGGEAVS